MFETPTTSTNVVSFGAHKKLEELQRDSSIFFPVEERALTDLTGLPDNGEKAVVRTDTNEIVAVNGRRYSLAQNKDVFRIVDEAIRRAQGLDTEGMGIHDSTSYNGGLTIRDYTFPGHSVEVGKVGDITKMRLRIVNSYNGSTQLRTSVDGMRLVCTNGMAVPVKFNRFNGRHTSGLNLEKMEARIRAGIQSFKNMGEMWKRYSQTDCSDSEAMGYIEKFTSSEKIRFTLFEYWVTESTELGKNLWALYNALTYYSSHHAITRGRGNEAATIMSRESDVSKVVEHFKVAA